METSVLDPPMAKQARNDVTAKIDAEVLAIAKMVAASRDMSLAEYLSERLRPIVKEDLDAEYGRRNPSATKGKGSK